MAELDQVAGDLFGNIFGATLWIGLGLILVFVIGIIMFYFLFYRKKFDIKVLIKSERAGDKYRIVEDRAAIIYDKKDKTYVMRLLNTKVDLPEVMYRAALQRTNTGDLIEFLKVSEDQLIPLTPTQVNKNIVVTIDGRQIPMAQQEQKLIEADVGYWAVKRKERNRRLFDAESLLMKILPYIPILVGGVIMIFMLYILFDTLPGLIQQLTELTRELRVSQAADITVVG